MSGKPVLHVGLVLIFGGLVFEYVGDLAYFLMVWRSCWVVPLGGGTWDAEGVPKKPVFVRDGGWGAGNVGANKAWHCGGPDKSEYGQSMRQE